jgi:hypothetical protein
MASMMSLYHRTPTGQQVVASPDAVLTKDAVHVLEAVGAATPFEDIRRAVAPHDDVEILLCLAALEAQGFVESVSAQWLAALCDHDPWEPAPLL